MSNKYRSIDICDWHQYIKKCMAIQYSSPVSLSSMPPFLSRLPFHDGDLVYGCNADRVGYEQLSGDSLGMLAFLPFSKTPSTSFTLPRLIDVYHDSIPHLDTELKSPNVSAAYKTLLQQYAEFLTTHGISLHTFATPHTVDFAKVCCLGLDFFLSQHKHIHIIIGSYNPQLNVITRQELLHVHALRNIYPGQIHYYRRMGSFLMPWDTFDVHVYENITNTYLQNVHQRLKQWMKRVQKDLNIQHGLIMETHDRFKDPDSIRAKIQSNKWVDDLVGFRCTSPWTSQTTRIYSHLMERLSQEAWIQVDKPRLSHLPMVHYITGHCQTLQGTLSAPFEIQIWPTVLYHCFEYEHSRCYKRGLPSQLLAEEVTLQDVIDTSGISQTICQAFK